MNKKTCKQCSKEFSIEEFNWQNKKKGIKRPYCCYCDRARAKKDYFNNREHKLELQKQWQKRTGYKAPGNYKHNAIPGVYMMINVETGEKYIGSSKNVYRRRSNWVVKNSHLNLDMSKFIWGVFNFNPEQEQPVVYPVDATRATLEEMGVLFNALGIAMTLSYAKERGMEHLLVIPEDEK